MKRDLQILTFLATTWLKLPFNKWSTADLCKFPVHEHYFEKKIVEEHRYRYDPVSKFEKDDLIKFLIEKIKKDFKANEVEHI
jgi:hypothetical protein